MKKGRPNSSKAKLPIAAMVVVCFHFCKNIKFFSFGKSAVNWNFVYKMSGVIPGLVQLKHNYVDNDFLIIAKIKVLSILYC